MTVFSLKSYPVFFIFPLFPLWQVYELTNHDNQYTKFKFGTVTCCIHIVSIVIISCQNVPMLYIGSVLNQCCVYIMFIVIISWQMCQCRVNNVSLLSQYCVHIVPIVIISWQNVSMLCQYCVIIESMWCPHCVPCDYLVSKRANVWQYCVIIVYI